MKNGKKVIEKIKNILFYWDDYGTIVCVIIYLERRGNSAQTRRYT